jgi:two-component system OmpR family response regulator
MRTVLRRTSVKKDEPPRGPLRVGDLTLDPHSHEVTKGGTPVQLGPREFRILYLLAMNEGRVVPYSRLVEYAWGYSGEGTSSLLRTHLSHLRKKLALPAAGPGSVTAVLGVGYSLARA